jgi:hypothetical protein
MGHFKISPPSNTANISGARPQNRIDFSSEPGVLILGPGRSRTFCTIQPFLDLEDGRSIRRSTFRVLHGCGSDREGDGDYRYYPGSRLQHVLAATELHAGYHAGRALWIC